MTVFKWLFVFAVIAGFAAGGYYHYLVTEEMSATISELRLATYNMQAGVRGMATTISAIEAGLTGAADDHGPAADDEIAKAIDEKLAHIEARLDGILPHLRHEQPQIIKEPAPEPVKKSRRHKRHNASCRAADNGAVISDVKRVCNAGGCWIGYR